ncbi:hypothetical protein C8Q80DRAFT_247996 [Daedaleopsis nitida]|nr:hypothetical protein C8Q80DRAFT_247996 [Daedaleopsis nitida]
MQILVSAVNVLILILGSIYDLQVFLRPHAGLKGLRYKGGTCTAPSESPLGGKSCRSQASRPLHPLWSLEIKLPERPQQASQPGTLSPHTVQEAGISLTMNAIPPVHQLRAYLRSPAWDECTIHTPHPSGTGLPRNVRWGTCHGIRTSGSACSTDGRLSDLSMERSLHHRNPVRLTAPRHDSEVAASSSYLCAHLRRAHIGADKGNTPSTCAFHASCPRSVRARPSDAIGPPPRRSLSRGQPGSTSTDGCVLPRLFSVSHDGWNRLPSRLLAQNVRRATARRPERCR